MKIRRYQPEDKIEPLISRSVRDVDPENYSSEQQRHLEEVIPVMNLEFAEENRYNYFVALEDDEIVGVAGYQSESGTVGGIFVDPDFKGSGIGSKLIDRIEDDAKREGLETMETLASLEAVDFYKKNGYKVTEEKKHDIEGKDIGIKVMKKQL
jgi:putative acetyltransferase